MSDIVERLSTRHSSLVTQSFIAAEAANEITALRARAEAAEQRLEEAKAVLEPFYNETPFYAEFDDDDLITSNGCVTVGNLRSAEAFLKKLEKTDG